MIMLPLHKRGYLLKSIEQRKQKIKKSFCYVFAKQAFKKVELFLEAFL